MVTLLLRRAGASGMARDSPAQQFTLVMNNYNSPLPVFAPVNIAGRLTYIIMSAGVTAQSPGDALNSQGLLGEVSLPPCIV